MQKNWNQSRNVGSGRAAAADGAAYAATRSETGRTLSPKLAGALLTLLFLAGCFMPYVLIVGAFVALVLLMRALA